MKCPICDGTYLAQKKGYRRAEFQLFLCRECGIGFISPLPDLEDLAQYYSSAYPLVDAVENLPATVPYHNDTWMIANFIKKLHPQAIAICEVGCAYGSLLAGLSKNGFNVKGFELSEPVAEAGRHRFGLSIDTGPLPPDLHKTFDVVIERHVLEHTLNPADEIRHIGNALRPGGIAILCVPNFASLSSILCGPGWDWFSPPDHLYYFDRKSMRTLLASQGLTLQTTFTRRGDAKNLFKAIIASFYNRAKLKQLHEGYWKQEQAPATCIRDLAWARRALSITTPLHLLASPFFFVINKLGYGEELWCFARKEAL